MRFTEVTMVRYTYYFPLNLYINAHTFGLRGLKDLADSINMVI